MSEIKHFDFLEEFGKIDDSLIEEAGRSWNKKEVPLYQKYGTKIAATLVILVGAVSIFSIPDVQADIWRFSTKIGEVLGIKNDLQPYVKVVNQSKAQNGITVQLNEAILDENCLLLSISEDIQEYTKKFQEERKASGVSEDIYPQVCFVLNEEQTKINGKTLECYESGVYLNENDLSLNTDFAIEGIEEEVMEMRFQNADYLSETSSKIVKVEVAIEAINAEDESREEAPLATFYYNFYVSRDQIQAMTKRKEVDIKIPLQEEELQVTRLTFNRIVSKIETKMDKEIYEKYQNSHISLAFRGEDDKGNPVQYNLSQYNEETGTLLFETDFMGMMELGQIYGIEKCPLAIPDDEATALNLQLYEVQYDEEAVDSNENQSDILEELEEKQTVIGGNEGETDIIIDDVVEEVSAVDEKVDDSIETIADTESEGEMFAEESIITGEHWNPIGEKFTIELSELR